MKRLALLLALLLAPALALGQGIAGNGGTGIADNSGGGGGCFVTALCTATITTGPRRSNYAVIWPLDAAAQYLGDRVDIDTTITGDPAGVWIGDQRFWTFHGTGNIPSHAVGLDWVMTWNNTGTNNLVRSIQPIMAFGPGNTTTLAQIMNPELQFSGNATLTKMVVYSMTWAVPTGSSAGNLTELECTVPIDSSGTISSRFCVNNNDPNARINTKGPISNAAGELMAYGVGCDTSRIYMGVRQAIDLSTFTSAGTLALYSRSIVATIGKVYLIPFSHHCPASFVYSNAYIRLDGAVAASNCFGQIYATAIGKPINAPLLSSPITWSGAATGQISATIPGGFKANPGTYLIAVYCDSAVTIRNYPEIAWNELVGLAGLTNIPQALVVSGTPAAFATSPSVTYNGSGADANIATPEVGLGF